jgi:hypothetical protein
MARRLSMQLPAVSSGRHSPVAWVVTRGDVPESAAPNNKRLRDLNEMSVEGPRHWPD